MRASTSLSPACDRPACWPWLLLLAGAITAAYGATFGVPFLYDDVLAIPQNPTIRRLWPLADVLRPQAEGGLTVSGRPVLNLSLAVNYALGGENVWGYHVFNLLVHIGSAFLLFGIVRRTAESRAAATPPADGRTADTGSGAAALPLAVAVAALWGLHPLLTQAVTYTVQRAESLMGFFYLLTLYGFIRSTATSARRLLWQGTSLAACVLGAGTKEVIATAPLLVLLYDRTFVAGTFRAALRRRPGYYVSLASTWILVGALFLSTGNRGGTVGPGVGVPIWAYPLTQFEALARYLGLSVWPHPLVFDYGTFWVQRFSELAPYAAVVLALLVATLVALRRRPVLGFYGASFFLILAPTSLAPGTIQMIVEHRMYLPLAAAIAAGVVGLQRSAGRVGLLAVLVAAPALGLTTLRRNHDYRSRIALWSDTVAKRPLSARAHDSLAEAYQEVGRHADALRAFAEAVRLQPDEYMYQHNLGVALANAGRWEEAIQHYQRSLRFAPDQPRIHNNLAVALGRAGRQDQALRHYAEAERLAPSEPQYAFNHGVELARSGRSEAAIERYRRALQLRPDYADAHANLAAELSHRGASADALIHARRAAELKPDDAELRTLYAVQLLRAQRAAEALDAFRALRRLWPDRTEARQGEAEALGALGRGDEAIAAYEALLRDNPRSARAHFALGNLLIRLNRVDDAAGHYERGLRLDPGDAEAHHNLGIAFARLERWIDARREFEAALHLKPDYPEAARHLQQLRSMMGR